MSPLSKFFSAIAIAGGLFVAGYASCSATYKVMFDNPRDESWPTLLGRAFTRSSANIAGGIGKEAQDILEESDLKLPNLLKKCDRETGKNCTIDDIGGFEKFERGWQPKPSQD
ncbi:MAG: hypothetical protein OEY94_09095 [Alphaproteobacteria bacterium]|nr:hypothetical protein [Alphaproteobacteria bacterium]